MSNTDQAKIHDAVDAIITMMFAEQAFNTELEINEDKRNELRLAILIKLDEMGVRLVDASVSDIITESEIELEDGYYAEEPTPY